MEIKENITLAPYTTFKIGGPARYFCVARDQFDALEAFEFAQSKFLRTFVLGGGSNVLISDEGFDGLVIKVENKGIEILNEDDNQVLLKAASGEVWDEVVEFAVKNNWWGIENLSHIPGGCGAIAVQNVGAYGQEAKDVLRSVDVFNKDTRAIQNLQAKDCQSGYRRSIFNTTSRGKFIIFFLTLNLAKNGKPNLSYKDLANRFSPSSQKGREKTVKPTLQEIREAIISIRDKKYPFPTHAILGNAGSFFKNPLLSPSDYNRLKVTLAKNFGAEKIRELEKKKFEEADKIKVPAAFLVETCGLKNIRLGGAAINANQPLVIINKTGTATAKEVLTLAEKVRGEVSTRCAVNLLFEPELVGFKM